MEVEVVGQPRRADKTGLRQPQCIATRVAVAARPRAVEVGACVCALRVFEFCGADDAAYRIRKKCRRFRRRRP